MSPRFTPHRPSLRPCPQTLQRPRPHFRRLAVQRFGHRPPPKAKPYLCIVKTKPPFAEPLPQPLRPIAHLPTHPARRSLKPAPPLPKTHPLLPHRPTSLIPSPLCSTPPSPPSPPSIAPPWSSSPSVTTAPSTSTPSPPCCSSPTSHSSTDPPRAAHPPPIGLGLSSPSEKHTPAPHPPIHTAFPSGNAPARGTPRLVHLLRPHRLAPFARPAPDFAPRPSDAGRFSC